LGFCLFLGLALALALVLETGFLIFLNVLTANLEDLRVVRKGLT